MKHFLNELGIKPNDIRLKLLALAFMALIIQEKNFDYALTPQPPNQQNSHHALFDTVRDEGMDDGQNP